MIRLIADDMVNCCLCISPQSRVCYASVKRSSSSMMMNLTHFMTVIDGVFGMC